MPELLNQQEKVVTGPDGRRWYKCKYCGKIGKEELFWTTGGQGELNQGVCYDCTEVHKKNREEQMEKVKKQKMVRDNSDLLCPLCGGKLIIRTARSGVYAGRQFYGCSNYPSCRYTRNK